MAEYIARISYGKDSLKMLDVIHSRGLPLDRITTTDVWATDTISANLPEMDAFKAKMDKRIKELYGIEVEHLCARNPDGSKKTYEQMFYHIPVRRSQTLNVERERENGPDSQIVQVEREREKHRQGTIRGFPDLWNPWCQAGLKRTPNAPAARDNHRIPTKHPVQLVSEAQTATGCNPRIPCIGETMVSGGTQVQSADTKDSQHRSPHGAESSRSTRSRPLFF